MSRGVGESRRTRHERTAEVIRISYIRENEYRPRVGGRWPRSQVCGKVEADTLGCPRAAGEGGMASSKAISSARDVVFRS